MKALAGVIGGFFLAALGAYLITMVLGSSPKIAGQVGAIGFVGIWIVGIYMGSSARSTKAAWRTLLLPSGVMALLLPLAGLVFTASSIVKNADLNMAHSDAHMAGMAIGGGLVTGCLAIVGIPLGIAFLIIALVVCKEKAPTA